ncbi:MAG: AraC family transcriptional regulator [Ruminococcaceae bacterium]|nr:AraC family transcriptional regulator [Oscillospiraceae bacterium]
MKYNDKSGLYSYTHSTDNSPVPASFKLHNHNNMNEILIFLEGNSEFHAEGSVYPLNPFDTVVAHRDEMHRIRHLEPLCRYERIVINIHNSFFTKYDCEEFKKIFVSRPLGANNLISGDIIQKSNIIDIATSIDNILKTDTAVPEIVIRSKLIDLLYTLNKISSNSGTDNPRNEQLRAILIYINENLSSPLTLESIAEKFFITKYHLCHIFKKQTGFSVNKYITHKRILLVRELYSQGKTLLEASFEAGFSNYSNFYKMYKHEMGKSPREDLK